MGQHVLKREHRQFNSMPDGKILAERQPLHKIAGSAAAEVGLALLDVQDGGPGEVHVELGECVVHELEFA